MKRKNILAVCGLFACLLLHGCEVKEEMLPEETVPEAIINIVEPLPQGIDINNPDNCTVAVSFEEGDAYVDDTGVMRLDVEIYTYDLYDMVDMASLKEGDTIRIRQKEVVVTSIEHNDFGTLMINGGIENGGYDFFTNDSGVYFECGLSDMKSYYEIGEVTLRVSPDFEFYDSSDLDKGEVLYYPGDFLTSDAGIVYHFVPYNTSIVIEDGMVIRMERVYTP